MSFNENIDRSDSESTQSTPEDERMKRLFFTCDTNGDGFITYDDIRQVCLQLNMECCVEEIMEQMGTDANGRISYADFVKKRSELLDIELTETDSSEDCESTISESKEPLLEESSQTSSFEMYSNRSSSVADEQAFGSRPRCASIGCDPNGIWGEREVAQNETESSGLSNAYSSLRHNRHDRHDSWEFDSGTHDLEIDTISLHKQIEASGIDMPSNINELLDLANRYYIESINCIKQEKNQIHSHLKSILREHEFLQKQTLCLKEEKVYMIRELEKKRLRERKEYEGKITELQSIIGELSNNLNYYQFLTIKEEDDENNGEANELCLQNNMDLDSNREIASKQSNSNANKNLELELNSNEREEQRENDWVLCETDVNKKIDVNDSHANALEIDRLECRITNLETQIDLSNLHLYQSSANADRLTVLLQKYDSNNTALQLALNYSDKALEVNELLIALLESEIGLVLANCRAAGLGKTAMMSEEEEREEVKRIYELANQNRKGAEESALDYLTKNCIEFEGKEINGFTREHEISLRDILLKLKLEKAIVSKSVTKLEPLIIDSYKDTQTMSVTDPMIKNSTLNIENTVLKSDFMAIKEQNASLKSEIYSLEKENLKLMEQMMKIKTNETNCIESDENKLMSDTIVNDLQIANGNLSEELEKLKKKYLVKVRKLEQKLLSTNQRNSAHVKILQNKISLLENEGAVRKCIETTL